MLIIGIPLVMWSKPPPLELYYLLQFLKDGVVNKLMLTMHFAW